MKFCPVCATPLVPRVQEDRTRLACSSESCDYVFYDNPAPVVAALLEHGDIVIGDEIAGVKVVPPDKLRPWPLGTGQAVRDWLNARGGLGPTVA